jgi:PTS system nitrogen regulatory IIA component
MELADVIARDAILPSLRAGSKKQIFQEIGQRARDAYGLDARVVVEGLLAREKLGSTAMGGGVAIPHARLAGLSSIVGLFARLEKPADFEAADGQGVDLVFVLLAPEESGADHLRALARVSRLLRDPETRAKLRETTEAAALYALITEPAASRAA